MLVPFRHIAPHLITEDSASDPHQYSARISRLLRFTPQCQGFLGLRNPFVCFDTVPPPPPPSVRVLIGRDVILGILKIKIVPKSPFTTQSL
jgi:hypothetical protein